MIKTWTSEELRRLGKSGYEAVGSYIREHPVVDGDCVEHQYLVSVECSNAGGALEYYYTDGVNGYWEGDWWEGGDVTLHSYCGFEEAFDAFEDKMRKQRKEAKKDDRNKIW